MGIWYRNKVGFPKKTLREEPNLINSKQVKNLISLFDIDEFFKICKYKNPCGQIENLQFRPFLSTVLNTVVDNKFTTVFHPRQCGFSTCISVLALYYTQIMGESVQIISRKNQIYDKIVCSYISLPDYVKFGVREVNNDRIIFNNGTQINFKSKYPVSDIILVDYIYSKKELCDLNIITKVRKTNKLLVGNQYNNTDGKIFGSNHLEINDIEEFEKQYYRNEKLDYILK